MAEGTKGTILIAIISAISAIVVAVITTYGTIAVSAPEAKRVKEEIKEISDLQLIKNLPIGTIVPSMLQPTRFAKAVGDVGRRTPEWVLADGQKDITNSRYGQLSGNTTPPDLRGMFLRGMNEGRDDGEQDPDPNRTPGSYQRDALQQHGHETDARKHGWGKMGGDTQGWTTRAGEAPLASVMAVQDARTADETRPKNVAVYFYIKIN